MNDYIANLEAEITQIETELKIKGGLAKKLMDEWLDLLERKLYLESCLKQVKQETRNDPMPSND